MMVIKNIIMKQFHVLHIFLIFSINLQSAEVDLQFTNFIDSVQLDVVLDQLIDIAGIQSDSIQKVGKIIYIFEKRYSAKTQQINELLTFLKVLEKEEPYRIIAKYAKHIIEDGLACMYKHQICEYQNIKYNNYDNDYEDSDWYIPINYEEIKEYTKIVPKITKNYILDLSDPIRGSINYLENFLQRVNSGTELSLIRQLILKFKNQTLNVKYFEEVIIELGNSEEIEELDFINLEKMLQALKEFLILKQNTIIKIKNKLIYARHKIKDRSDFIEIINGVISELKSNKDYDLQELNEILDVLEDTRIQKELDAIRKLLNYNSNN